MYTFKISTKKNKKYDVYKNDKYLVSFGDINYQHYFDKLGHYSHLNHLVGAKGSTLKALLFEDLKRKQNYYKRFGKKEDAIFVGAKAQPTQALLVKESAKYFSHNYLW